MDAAPSSEITSLLRRIASGDDHASDELLKQVYADLHRLAEHHMRGQKGHHTLQVTALVSEVYLKLFAGHPKNFNDRLHFRAACAQAMRSILVDHARSKQRQKRSAYFCSIDLDTLQAAFENRAIDILVLDEALNDFAQIDPKMCKAVTARFFSGLSPDEAADVAGISRRTLDRKWQATLAWLYRRIS